MNKMVLIIAVCTVATTNKANHMRDEAVHARATCNPQSITGMHDTRVAAAVIQTTKKNVVTPSPVKKNPSAGECVVV